MSHSHLSRKPVFRVGFVSKLAGMTALVFSLGLGCQAFSAGVTALKPGLEYLRLARLPADLPSADTAFSETGTLVVDLRGASEEKEGTSALVAWLDFRCKSSRATLLLLNGHTSLSLRRELGSLRRPALVTLAPSGADVTVDLKVDTDTEADLKACEAIDKGGKLETLYAPKLDKERNDEARLSKEHQETARQSTLKEYEPGEETPSTQPKPQPVLVDLVLARAVQLHEAVKIIGNR